MEGCKGKTGRIQGKDRKDTKEKQEGYKGKTRRIQGEQRKDTREKHK